MSLSCSLTRFLDPNKEVGKSCLPASASVGATLPLTKVSKGLDFKAADPSTLDLVENGFSERLRLRVLAVCEVCEVCGGSLVDTLQLVKSWRELCLVSPRRGFGCRAFSELSSVICLSKSI